MKTGGSLKLAVGAGASRVFGCMLFACMLGAGCAYGEVRQVIRAQFASDTDCADVKLAKRSTWYAEDNPHQYKVTGCGVVRSYTCTEDQAAGFVSYDEPACTWVEGDADAPKMKPQTSGGDDMDGMEPMDDMGDEPPMDEPAAEPEDDSSGGDDMGGEADSAFDAEASGDAQVPKAKAKAKAKAKGGFKLGSD